MILKHVQGHELTLWSLPSDANISSAYKGIPRILWNLKVHYHIYNSPSHVPEADEYSPYPRPRSWRYIPVSSSPLRLDLPSVLFPSIFPTKTLYSTRSLYFWQIFCPLFKRLPPRFKWSLRFPGLLGTLDWQFYSQTFRDNLPVPYSRVKYSL